MASELPQAPAPSDDPDIERRMDLTADLNVAARALMLGAALHAPEATNGLVEEMPSIGFHDLPAPVARSAYPALVAQSDELLADYGLAGHIDRRERSPGLRRPGSRQSIRPPGQAMWQQAAHGDPIASVAWLRSVQAIYGGVRQVAAAAALQPARFDENGEPTGRSMARPARAAQQVLSQAAGVTTRPVSAPRESADAIGREIAQAALGIEDADHQSSLDGPGLEAGPTLAPVSTIVHGTNAYKGAWWTPRGDFHQFLKATIDPDLYAEGQYFQWSGAYSAAHRKVAAQRLVDWSAPYGHHLQRVYAHSYGGVIALRALELGLRVDELVLLSTPVEAVPTDWNNVGRIVSLRIHFDLVLLAAFRRQTFNLPVAEYHLPKWFVRHDDSHEVNTWIQHDVARAVGLSGRPGNSPSRALRSAP